MLSPFAKQRTKKVLEELDWGSMAQHRTDGLNDPTFVLFLRVSYDQ